MTRRIKDHYELTDRLGRGGMGEVWVARDQRLDRLVAVKFLSAGGRGSDLDRMEQRFMREARLTARIGHRSVPVVHEWGRLDGDDGDGLYLVMELVHGDTLSRLLKQNGPFSVHLAAAVAVQTADAPAHAHHIGVVHRDLKPSNLMLTPDGTVKVLDFGIAAVMEPDPDEPRLTRTQEVLGTPGFISPEQADGGHATERSDLYALGCVLYEILAGRPPFTAGTAVALLYRHAYEEPPPLGDLRNDVPTDFTSLVMRLLAKSPDDRPSAEEVHGTARAWLARPPDRAAPRQPSAGSGAVRSASASVSSSASAGPAPSRRPVPVPRPAPSVPSAAPAAAAPGGPGPGRPWRLRGGRRRAGAATARGRPSVRRHRVRAGAAHPVRSPAECRGVQPCLRRLLRTRRRAPAPPTGDRPGRARLPGRRRHVSGRAGAHQRGAARVRGPPARATACFRRR
ncbi:serine/threonine-protein kinase [Streptomyces sp. L7]